MKAESQPNTDGKMHVAALYRYPIKGFRGENRESLTISQNDRAEGDRVWSLRFPRGTTPAAENYWPKGDGLCLRDYPSLAKLRLHPSTEPTVITLGFPGEDTPRTYRIPADRQCIERDITEFLLAHPQRRELEQITLMGDGETPRFQDRAPGFLTAHFSASTTAVAQALGTPVDERRFRSNIVIEGGEAWAEHDLVGKTITIGTVSFRVEALLTRCLAINVGPESGTRDLCLLQGLTREVGLEKPTFGVSLLPLPHQEGKEITVGAPFFAATT